MNIVNKTESREQCTEAGWYAYDYELESEVTRDMILRLRELGGNFVYLTSLALPFYKVEEQYFMIKGTEGRKYFRLSMYKEYEEEICSRIEKFVTEI